MSSVMNDGHEATPGYSIHFSKNGVRLWEDRKEGGVRLVQWFDTMEHASQYCMKHGIHPVIIN